MRRAHRLALAVFLACVVPADAQTPATEEPTEPYVAVRINVITGALMPLESMLTKPERSGNSYYCYLEGAASTVAFPSGERHSFMMRVGGLKGLPNVENWRKVHKLERLMVGKRGRRYATKDYIPLDITTHGQVTSTLDKKNKPIYWITLVSTPLHPLPPGEYAISGMGLSSPAGFTTKPAQAFRIVEGMALTRPAAPLQTPPAAANASPERPQLRTPASTGTASSPPAVAVEARAPSAPATLADGISQARSGDFVNALVTLNEVVGQMANRPAQPATLARAHAYRAVALVGVGQLEWAKAAVLQALQADPRIAVDATEFGARVAALFDNARRPARDPEAAGQAAELAGRFQDAFLAYLSAIQSLPEPPAPTDDQRLREKIINVVGKLETKPSVPEEARTYLAKAAALMDSAAVPGASSGAAAERAAIELRKAVRIAPWWPDAMVQLAIALQQSGRLDDALLNLNLYQLADPQGYAAKVGSAGPAHVESPERITAPEPDPAAIAPAVIYVFFPRAARGRGIRPKLRCNGQHVADMAHGRFVMLNVPPGFYSFEFNEKKTAASFEGGKDHYIRVAIDGFPARFALRITDPAKAAAEMREKQLVANEQNHTFSAGCAGVAAAPAR